MAREAALPHTGEMKTRHHTFVDHRPGGPRVAFGVGAWCAIDIAAVKADRALASISAFESLIEQFQTSEPARQSSAIFRSVDHRRVVTFLELRGHAEFRNLAAAWDDHHLYAEHRANAEASVLGLYRVLDSAGDARIDASSSDRYDLERIARPASSLAGVLAKLPPVPGFRGALLLGSDDEMGSIIVFRFAHETDFDAFRTGTAALASLGPIGVPGESEYPVHPVKTFGVNV